MDFRYKNDENNDDFTHMRIKNLTFQKVKHPDGATTLAITLRVWKDKFVLNDPATKLSMIAGILHHVATKVYCGSTSPTSGECSRKRTPGKLETSSLRKTRWRSHCSQPSTQTVQRP